MMTKPLFKILSLLPILILIVISCSTVEKKEKEEEKSRKTRIEVKTTIDSIKLAQYRTNELHPNVLAVPTTLENNLKTHPREYLDDLVIFLVRDEQDPYVRVKILHDWIAENITYDATAYFSGSRTSSKYTDTLVTGKAVCEGYAELFKEMCTIAELDTIVIHGYSRGYGLTVFSDEDVSKPNHAWNAVLLEGRWHLFDVTWDAGYLNANEEYVKEYNNSYLFLEPERMIYSHLPLDEKWQLLSPPISEQEFKQLPFYRGNYFAHGLKPLESISKVTRVSAEAKLEIATPSNSYVIAEIQNKEGMSFEQNCFYQKRNGETEIHLTFPESGRWTIRLFVKRSEEEEYTYCAELGFIATSGSPRTYPLQYRGYQENGIYLYEPLKNPLSNGTEEQFTIKLPGYEKAAVVIGEEWFELEREADSDIFTGLVTISSAEKSSGAEYTQESESGKEEKNLAEVTIVGTKSADASEYEGIVSYSVLNE